MQQACLRPYRGNAGPTQGISYNAQCMGDAGGGRWVASASFLSAVYAGGALSLPTTQSPGCAVVPNFWCFEITSPRCLHLSRPM